MNKTVLIIDDEKMLHTMLKSVLAAHSIDVISAMSGEEGLKLLSVGRPDLIILDVLMPGMKGREVCRVLKASKDTKDIPVLFLTAKDSEDDMRAEFELGAVGHITKPINSNNLVKRVKEILGA
jgi:putative two-component system response regulator